MIVKVQGGGGGTYANTGTSAGVVSYLQHEDAQRMQEGQRVEEFFNQEENRVKSQEVIDRIDNNRKGLKAKEAKFYVITIAPSARELSKMGRTRQEQAEAMRDYIRKEVMPRYAEGFNKGIKADDLVYYAKIHYERDKKAGEDLHAHIIISHKTQDNGKAISPNTNHTGKKSTGAVKGGFNRKDWFQGCEQGFDRMFAFDRNMKESFQYRNTIKHGTIDEINKVVKQLVKKEMELGKGQGKVMQKVTYDRKAEKKRKDEIIARYERERKEYLEKTVQRDDDIEKVGLLENTSGAYLSIRYKDKTGETYRLNEREKEAIKENPYRIDEIANRRAEEHRNKVMEDERVRERKGGRGL